VGSGTLQLPEVMNLSAAAPLAKALSERQGADLVLDASEVRQLGALCLQVLLSAAATWKAAGASLRIVNRSEEFAAGLQVVGVPATAFAD
jgi:chemotaxis protein CheX